MTTETRDAIRDVEAELHTQYPLRFTVAAEKLIHTVCREEEWYTVPARIAMQVRAYARGDKQCDVVEGMMLTAAQVAYALGRAAGEANATADPDAVWSQEHIAARLRTSDATQAEQAHLLAGAVDAAVGLDKRIAALEAEVERLEQYGTKHAENGILHTAAERMEELEIEVARLSALHSPNLADYRGEAHSTKERVPHA